jgi:hypothetical protein
VKPGADSAPGAHDALTELLASLREGGADVVGAFGLLAPAKHASLP